MTREEEKSADAFTRLFNAAVRKVPEAEPLRMLLWQFFRAGIGHAALRTHGLCKAFLEESESEEP